MSSKIGFIPRKQPPESDDPANGHAHHPGDDGPSSCAHPDFHRRRGLGGPAGLRGKSKEYSSDPIPEVNEAYLNPELGERWKTLIMLKGEISKAVEMARKNKIVGHPLDAAVDISPPGKARPFWSAIQEDPKDPANRIARSNLVETDDIQGTLPEHGI